MPFVQRVLEPVYLSRKPLRDADGAVIVKDYELEAVNNNTLSSALRQLASLVLVADDIFKELTKQLHGVCDRSRKLRSRIGVIEEKVAACNPKTVTVPESDICTFSLLRSHFTAPSTPSTALFTASSRPRALQDMYDACVKTPVHVMREMDAYRRDGARSSRYFMCTPVLGGRRKRRHRDVAAVETSKPAVFEDLRRWTSIEALGDVTVAPDCTSRITPASVSVSVTVDLLEEVDAPVPRDDATDHKLPSPEEQVQVVALHFPAEVVPVDVSGRVFARMSSVRRSMGLDGTVVRRRERSRRARGKRRNTIAACTDKKELEDAVVAGDSANDSLETTDAASTSHGGRSTLRTRSGELRSRSSDLLRSKTDMSPPDKKSHLTSLRQWGSAKLRLIRGKSQELHPKSPPMPEDFNIYEAINKGKKSDPKKPVRSSLPISTVSGAMSLAVKLREGSLRRQKRTKDSEPVHSSSGNWSASSESGRASVGSETTTATPQPRSTTMSSPGTSSQSLHQAPSSVSSRRRFNTSTSSSFSEGTLTPDIGSDLPFVDDGENSSIYSCDTEGYYTSFHLDSGLKPLKEEDTPMTPLHSTTALSHSPRTLSAENEYELFGKGSTSTTTSSAGTVCTTLLAGNNDSSLSLALAPAVPERKSSLETKSDTEKVVVAMIHKELVSYSPDSGHNTSSSPVDSTSSPHGTLRSSEYEFSESDFEGVERIERIRVKTTIRSSHIPSMCVITPPQSDDEISLNHYVPFCRNPEEKPNNEPKYYSSLPRSLEKQISSDSSENEYAKVNKKRTLNKNDLKLNFLASLQTNTEKLIQETHFDVELTPDEDTKHNNVKAPLHPFNNMLEKVKDVYATISSKKTEDTDIDEGMLDSGDYVTIADVRNNKNMSPQQALYANCTNTKSPVLGKVRETEYVSLNELPNPANTAANINLLHSPVDSLERKKRQGARVTLDSEGKVVYSSDSLKRVKGHSTFEPGPYIKETILTPTASPIPLHRVPKTNIRPVNLQGKNSPLPIHTVFPATYTDKTPSPILLRKNQSPTRTRLSPNSPKLGKVIIRANSPATRVVSPTSPRAMSPKRIVSPTATRTTRSISPKAIGKVVSPVSARSVSPKTIVSPTTARPMSPRARGAYVHMLGPERCTSPPRSSLNLASTTSPEEEVAQRQPPRYISPPSANGPTNHRLAHNPSDHQHTKQRPFNPLTDQIPPPSEPNNTYWTLPSRRRQDVGLEPPRSLTPNSYRQAVTHTDGIHYNTIAVRSQSQQQCNGYVKTPYNQRPSSLVPGSDYPSHSAGLKPQSRNICSKPASIPHVPTNAYEPYQVRYQPSSVPHLSSSTPNKELCYRDQMDFSLNFSPIQKQPNHRSERTTAPNEPPRLISPPRTSMTSEEIFAIIHRSKKRLNIKTDADTFSRSGSPASSLSPGNSESSINGRISEPVPSSRGRNSWSPNSSEYYDFYTHFENRASTPVSAGSRQSWACDRLGPAQTTRNDFKRLLLQHGPNYAARPEQNAKLSAVEQLRLTRQQKLSSPTQPRSPVDKRGVKLMPAPRSPAWRFASPRTDVLSSTILEDCDEEERAERSPHNSPPRGSLAPRLPNVRRPLDGTSFQNTSPKRQTFNNPSIRRPLDASFTSRVEHSSKSNPSEQVSHFENPSVCMPMEPINRLAVGKPQHYHSLRNSPLNSPVSSNDRVSEIPLPGEGFLPSQSQKTSTNASNFQSYDNPRVQSPRHTPLTSEPTHKTIPPNTKSTPESNPSSVATKRLSPRELFLGYSKTQTTDTIRNESISRQSSPGHKYLQTSNNTSNQTTTAMSNYPTQSAAVQDQNPSNVHSRNQLPPYYTPYTQSSNNQTTSSKVQPAGNNPGRFTLPIYNKPSNPELLSPLNVKENFNSFQIQNENNVSPSKAILSHSSAKSNGTAGQLWNAQSSALISNLRSTSQAQSQSPKVTTLPRNILGTIESKSPQKVSLETSL